MLKALILGLLFAACVGCSTVSPYADPFSEDRNLVLPINVFDVEWALPLVPPQFLEYAPREVAPVAIEPASSEGAQTGHVVALTRDGVVRAITRTGELAWTFTTSSPFSAGATIANEAVFVPGGDGVLYALKLRSGGLLWKYGAGEELATAPVVTGGRVFVASHGDTLFVVEQQTGKWLWQYRRDSPGGFTVRGAAAPRVALGTVYIGFSDGAVVALNADTGAVKWERQLSTGVGEFLDADAGPVLDDAGNLYVASYRDGVYALDAESGEVRWKSPHQGVTALNQRGQVVFAAGDSQVTALFADNGRSIWTVPVKERTTRLPVLAARTLVVSASSALLFVDPISGRLNLSWDPGRGVSAPPTYGYGRLFVLSNTGHLYSLKLGGGKG